MADIVRVLNDGGHALELIETDEDPTASRNGLAILTYKKGVGPRLRRFGQPSVNLLVAGEADDADAILQVEKGAANGVAELDGDGKVPVAQLPPLTSPVTAVVHPTPGVGDYTTIQAAIDALPSAGGIIAIREGTYNLAAALTLPDKPIVFVGSGENTLISIGSNSIAVLDHPVGGANNNPVVFMDMRIQGDGTSATSRFADVAADSATYRLVRVTLNGIQKGVRNLTEFAGIVLELFDCNFSPSGPGTALAYEGVGANTVAQIKAVRSVLVGAYTGTNVIVEASARSLVDIITSSTIRDLFASASDIGSGAQVLTITGDEIVVQGCKVRNILTVSGDAPKLVGNKWLGSPTRCIDLTSACEKAIIAGNVFTFSSEAIRTGGTGATVTGNVECKVLETGAADINYYGNNHKFEGSTIIGPTSTVDGRNTRIISTTPVTLNETHKTVLVDATGGDVTLNLPSAASAKHRRYDVKKTDASANTVTIDGDGAETIDDATTLVLTTQYQAFTIESDGTEWWIL